MAHLAEDNPFVDPSVEDVATPPQSPLNVPDTLEVGRNASLTLATDSLIVLGTKDLCKEKSKR